MIIQWDVLPHEEQRYETCGDWFFTGDVLRVVVSRLSDPRYEKLIAIHETIEAMICQQMGIDETDVTAFDVAYEECRNLKISAPCGCWISPHSEPGDDLHAPYHKAHVAATRCEREVGIAWGVNMRQYENEVESL
jgi:hypothetical protein